MTDTILFNGRIWTPARPSATARVIAPGLAGAFLFVAWYDLRQRD